MSKRSNNGKAKSPRNASYDFNEVIYITIPVEIAYSRKEARSSAIDAAESLAEATACGGGGINGCYNAVRLGKPTVSYRRKSGPKKGNK